MKKTMISVLLFGSAIFLEIGMSEAKTVDRVDDISARSSGVYAVSKSVDSEPVENGWDENDGKIKNVSARLVINTSKTRVSSRDIDMNENDIKLTLRTIPYRGLKDDSYWLDNGILING